MSITFRFIPKKNGFNSEVREIFLKLDKNPFYSDERGENFAQIKLSEDILNMPDKFFPKNFRKIIQKELKEVTIKELACVSLTHSPGNGLYHIGDVAISVTGVHDYFFVSANIFSVIRALIVAKKIQNKLKYYTSPTRFYPGEEIVSKEVSTLLKSYRDLKRRFSETVKIFNETADNLTKANEVIKQLNQYPPKWKFWLWEWKWKK